MLLVFFAGFHLHAQVLDTLNVTRLDKPGNVESSLNASIPQRESLFDRFLLSENYDDWKGGLYKDTGLKIGVSYQGNLMHASSTIAEPDNAAAGLFAVQADWTPLNFGKDYEGSLVFSYNNIHNYGKAVSPALFSFNTGSMFAHDGLYLDVPGFISNLYWEQWFKRGRFFIRVGQHVPGSVIDFSRFADVRTSVTSPSVGFPAGSIPFGPPAMGITAKLLTPQISGFYALVHFSDINSQVDKLNVGNIFETGEFFAAGEVGYKWFRRGDKGIELDHLHLIVFGATEASSRRYQSEGGWGFKVATEKQVGSWIVLANYAYNNAVGGGFGFTKLRHAINLGGAYNKPFGVKGELFLVYTWGQELDNGQCGLLPCTGRQQSMIESYWKLLVFPQLWVTPGLQVHINPVDNPNTKAIWLPLLKFRVFF